METQLHVISQKTTLGYESNEFSTNGEALLLRALLKPKHLLVDIGAHTGEYGRIALDHEPTVRLICFEPCPEFFQQLTENLKNPSAELHQLALSDRQGTSPFYALQGGNAGLSSMFYRKDFIPLETRALEVQTETLDHFCESNNIEKIDFVKIDVEGNELNVLKGASKLLNTQAIRMIQFEYGGTYADAGIRLEEVLRLLTEANYLVFRLFFGGLIYISQWEPSLECFRYCNYLAIAGSEIKELKPMEF